MELARNRLARDAGLGDTQLEVEEADGVVEFWHLVVDVADSPRQLPALFQFHR